MGAVGGASRTGDDGRCEVRAARAMMRMVGAVGAVGMVGAMGGKSLGKLLPLSSYLLALTF